MTLLKAKEYQRKAHQVEAFNLTDIGAEAAAIVESARAQARELIAEARALIEADRQQAHSQGLEDGHAKGFEQGRQDGHQQALTEARQQFEKQSREAGETLKKLFDQFEQNKNQLLWQAEQHTVALAQSIAEKVTKQIGILHPEATVENIKAALELTGRRTGVVVRINPAAMEHLERMQGEKNMPAGEWKHIRFEKDENISAGGCVVETEHGGVDAQVETQLQRIAESLLIQPADITDKGQ